ncbi:MAG: RidA family protein [Nitriliruptor sp.]|nr:MAG: RidA family protein [Nitriliruptor sp.]
MSSTGAARLADLGLTLPEVPAPAAAYQPWSVSGELVFTAGQLPLVAGALPRTGRLGVELTTADGAELARLAALNLLAVGAAACGSLEAFRVVKVVVFVASSEGFEEQHLVANGASQLLGEVLGDRGVHARSAVGVPALPLGAPVEVEAILEQVPA